MEYGGGTVDFKFGVYNRSTRLQYITAAYLDIASSASDMQPAVSAAVGRHAGLCATSIYGPTAAFANFGWSAANNATLNLAFTLAGQTVPPGTPKISRRLGRIDKQFTLDLEPDLQAAGLNISFLKSRAQGTLCQSKTKNACIQQLKSSGVFGALSNLVNSDDGELFLNAIGNLEYEWVNQKGDVSKRTSRLEATITQGRLSPLPTGCAEMAGPEVVVPKPLTFRLDRTGYRIPISFSQRALPPGQTTWIKLPLDAQKSSQHEFRVFVRMADGNEFPSRSIKLLYYVPSWGQSAATKQLHVAGSTFRVPTLWDHNGSILALEANGADRVFYYVKPKPSLVPLVSERTLLFKGKRVGNRYEGIARVFSCNESFEYPVSGQVSADEREITMQGRAPLIDGNCAQQGTRLDTLKMTLVESQ